MLTSTKTKNNHINTDNHNIFPNMTKTNIAIFASGSGTNCENIIRYFANHDSICVAVVLCNKADAGALERAKRLGVPAIYLNKEGFNSHQQMSALLSQYDVNFIVLAGFLLMVPDFLIKEFHHRMINIHPALLPKYGGKGMYGHHVHEAVCKAGEKETGFTVHWVSEVCDGGEIIAQVKTDLTSDDTPETIAAKEHVLEMDHFPRIIEEIISCR